MEFLHIPKTGGVSICQALGRKVTGHHKPSRKAFCFIREPFDRFISTFYYLQAGGRNAMDKRDRDQWIGNLDIHRFVREQLHAASKSQMHFRPQTTWLNNKVVFYGRYHHLQQDFDYVCQMMNIKPRPLPVTNTSKKQVVKFSEQERAIIKSVYQADYDLYHQLSP